MMYPEALEKPLNPTLSTFMEAAVITAPSTIEIKKLSLPEPKNNEVRILMEGSGVCASNIPVWEGREWFNYPIEPGNPGHEGWGVIDTVGEEVTDFKPGDKVCCLSYHAYATHDIAPATHVVKIPEQLEDTPFPGEPMGCAMNIFERSDIHPGHTVAVVGSGFLGLLLIQLLKSAGAKVIAISRRKFSLEAATSCGADETIVMDDHWKIIEQVKEITGNQLCERVIEVTGKEWPLNLSIELTAEKGKLIVAGFHQDGMRQVNMQMLNWRGIDMINAHERDPMIYLDGMRNAIQAILDKKMNPLPLFTHQYQLNELDKAFTDMINRPNGFIKALIKF